MASVTDRQVRRLHALLKSGKPLLVAAMRVDMDRKTARKYRDETKLPSELETWPRTCALGKTPLRTSGRRCENNWKQALVCRQKPSLSGSNAATQVDSRMVTYAHCTVEFGTGKRSLVCPRKCSSPDPSSRPAGCIGLHPHDEFGRDDQWASVQPYGLPLRSHLLELGVSLDLLLGELRESE